MNCKLTIVILTYNEEVHIERAIKNISNYCDKIIVLDSYSQDKTVEIAKKLDAEVIFRKFDDYKNQRQYAIDYCANKTEWMLFLDADEYLLDDLKNEILIAIENKNSAGYYLSRRFIFMGKWIKYGGYYPCYLLRLFRPEMATLEGIVNEHVNVNGKVKKLNHDFVDHNLKNIASWIEKHNKYTNLEAENLWFLKHTAMNTKKFKFHIQAERKQWIKQKIWNHLPLLSRSLFYFIYRYFFCLGFLDGKPGLIFHLLQGGWNYFLVDVKYIEMKNQKNS
ncbi:MAG: glycosyltransferase family 2 protein [Gammaproteobacteria bacterium CG_4_10_14_0_8_um_filter_38_16]|nr:MAG: glycosyltransferase family 2 protein [Gammaproteobacteria bacterium CG_4_10_14_0_8_um_filter_38_16]PJA02805.1 MAG: glycosyltransferase family 2 protein [Gammaproteobacteria bacterium CG_4_10_14_0_2_um_filter_38_22]PJB10704.1 MAG: glycosyltransferase family 2 protein [Gammaproteobacteria bacterium CG_4_9_14_3_um_filter_38_9]